jgi:hypothetical protein
MILKKKTRRYFETTVKYSRDDEVSDPTDWNLLVPLRLHDIHIKTTDEDAYM